MEINNEQLKKLFDLSDIETLPEEAVSEDINKALIAIERKINSFCAETTSIPAEFSILIVDDLELSIFQFNQLLKKIGIVPTVARNKTEALAELKKKKFDYIVVDLFLPDAEDGIEIIEESVRLREAKLTNKIIVMSGTDDKLLIEKCFKLGPVRGFFIILKFITNTLTSKTHEDFFKYSINENICCYTINKFNTQKHIDLILKDVTTSVYTGYKNIIFNMENIKIFDEEQTTIFTELYKLCDTKGGKFIMVKISDAIKNALEDAFLNGIIPVYNSIDIAISNIKD